MSRVRIEIWDNEDNVRSAEVEHSDSRTAFDRARRMAEATLPLEETGPKLNAGSYTFEMKNVQFTDVTKQLLFMDAEGRKRAQSFDVRVVGGGGDGRCPKTAPGRGRGNRCTKDGGHSGQHVGEVDGWRWSDPDPTPTQAGEARRPCETPCPDEDCGDRCARPVLHDGQHSTADGECIWDRRTFQTKPEEQCSMICDKANPDCWDRCVRENYHDGDCWCTSDHDESLCLNEIGAPSATRTCHQKLGHEGYCDGDNDG